MRALFLIVGLATLLTIAFADDSKAACGDDCDATYSGDVDDCHSQYGTDPEDADDLAECTQNARDSYDSCLEECKQ
ncbi:MAG: hypothetical protein WDN29_01460 [Methylovirgula sp.]